VFWHLSLVGAVLLFTYAIYRGDPVFILGQGVGFIVYSRNLYLSRQSGRSKANRSS
jgi:lipid-A-disaccharide synthase-like uncharacterized protein